MQDLFGDADYFPELKEVLIAENVSVSSELNDVLVHKMDLLPKLDLLCVNVRKNNEVRNLLIHFRQ
jgi:hypothetical protein